jgi:hypothetical protein
MSLKHIMLTEFFNFPLIFFTFPALILSFLWLVSVLGFLDIEFLDFDFSSDTEVDGSSLFEKLGFDGVPLLVILTLVDFYGLAFTYSAKKILLPLFDDLLTATAAGATIAIFSLIIAIALTSVCVRPMRRFFVVHEGESKDDWVGLICTVTTQQVTETFGQASSDQGLVMSIRANTPNIMKKGTRIVLLEYIQSEDCYTVITEEELHQP